MRKRVVKWLGIGGLSLLVLASITYAAIPGYHRAITPAAFGMTKVTNTFYIDDPAQAETTAALIAQAEKLTSDFFGALRADPIYIVCTTQDCKDRFGLKPRGLSLGYHLILIDHIDDSALIFAHERIHAELHRFMGLTDLFHQRYPAWFDEGLASHISGDTRLNRPANVADADWIKAAHSFQDWGRLHQDHHWQDTYGAAARQVEEIEAHLGRSGLLDLIQVVGDGADFNTTLGAQLPIE